jgi:hypothetical protein
MGFYRQSSKSFRQCVENNEVAKSRAMLHEYWSILKFAVKRHEICGVDILVPVFVLVVASFADDATAFTFMSWTL